MIFEAKKDKLIHNNKIEIRRSELHGYGVFAKDFIKKGEILEECHIVEVWKTNVVQYGVDRCKLSSELKSYVFSWPKGDMEKILETDSTKGMFESIVIPTGFGLVYNSSKDAYGANANWIDTDENIFIFGAVKNINKDEEILINYSKVLNPARMVDVNELLYISKMDKMVSKVYKRTKPKVFKNK